MKLRIRSLESKETLKIETPNPSSFQNLKDAIAEKISAPPETLNLSLNRKDEIMASPTDSLSSLGIASGDLIYYTRNPNGFSPPQAPIQFPRVAQTPIQVPQVENHPIQASNPELETLETKQASQTLEMKPISDGETLEALDSEEGVEENTNVMETRLSSVPRFLENVYKEEMGYGNTEGIHKLLIIAVHAVFLESGFVCYDTVQNKKVNGFRLPEGWASKLTLGVRYTVPPLLGGDVVETVGLKFQSLGKFVCVHGSLSREKPVGLFRLDARRFVPSLNSLCVSNGGEGDGFSKSHHEKEVFELWKIAKDGLALPLLIELCEKTGLESPPCFVCLPTELKLKILELLPGVDIARVGCVTSELKYLSSNKDLWKQKFMEEFPSSNSGVVSNDNWKQKYVVSRERIGRKRRPYFHPFCPGPFPSIRREPRPLFGFPGVIGGDYDLFPTPFGMNQGLRSPTRRNFVPNCDLGGFDA